MKKVILITARVDFHEKFEEVRDVLDQELSRLIEGVGYIPLLMPNCLKNINGVMRRINPSGVILSGGNDINPSLYGRSQKDETNISNDRDQTEIKIARYAIKHGIPLLGICRGMQLINVLYGGSLIQNIRKEIGQRVNHVASHHKVFFNEHIFLKKYRNKSIKVNSFHNQGMTEEVLSRQLVPAAKSDDDVVEALVALNDKVLGIMWHPERRGSDSQVDQQLIKKFFDYT